MDDLHADEFVEGDVAVALGLSRQVPDEGGVETHVAHAAHEIFAPGEFFENGLSEVGEIFHRQKRNAEFFNVRTDDGQEVELGIRAQNHAVRRIHDLVDFLEARLVPPGCFFVDQVRQRDEDPHGFAGDADVDVGLKLIFDHAGQLLRHGLCRIRGSTARKKDRDHKEDE